MEVGKNGFSERELQRFYPKMHKKLFTPKHKISKTAIKKARLSAAKVKVLAVEPAKPVKLAKVKAPKKAKVLAEKLIKKNDRLDRNNSKLLEQLTFLNQRIETMERDKELYALVHSEHKDNTYKFTVVRIGDDKPLILEVNERFEMSCSCMDWRIRCRGLSVACKHIYYLLVKILTYELYDYYDNQIMDPEGFKYLLRRRVDFGDIRFDAGRGDELGDQICAVCYNALNDNNIKDDLLKCPDCTRHFHKGCVNAWMQHSKKRNCVYCRSEKWNMYFGNRV